MNNTAKRLKDTADTIAESAVSKAREGLYTVGEAAMKAGKPKRNRLKIAVFAILGAALVGAVVMFVRNQNS
jgi:hypothetical protein